MKSLFFIVFLGAVIISAGCVGGNQNTPDTTDTIPSGLTQQTYPLPDTLLYTCPKGQECQREPPPVPLTDNRTPAQKKISTDLLLLTDNRYIPYGMTRNTLEQQMEQNHQLVHDAETGKILVYVYIEMNTSADITLPDSFVWNVTDRDPANHLVVAWADVNDLIPLASLDSVRSIHTVIPPETGWDTR